MYKQASELQLRGLCVKGGVEDKKMDFFNKKIETNS